MYDELVKRLREHNGWALNETLDQAADAFEELSHEYEKLAEDFNGAVELLHKRGKPRWIPVTERLPENGQDVLVWVSIGKAPIVAYDVDCYNERAKRWVCFENDVTHWMPLPPAPKEESYGV